MTSRSLLIGLKLPPNVCLQTSWKVVVESDDEMEEDPNTESELVDLGNLEFDEDL